MLLSLNNITFSHKGAVDPLFNQMNIHCPTGWTGIVGANGTGKTTLLQLACSELKPDSGTVIRPGIAIYCPQRTDSAPIELLDFTNSLDPTACDVRRKMAIGDDWYERWETLSHGERKRAQIAVALWHKPDVLALDEPTNHIDADAQRLLISTLKSFHGIGLLVSHDRELLDELCRQCVFLEPPIVIMRPGNYTDATYQAKLDDQHIRDEYDRTKTAVQRLRLEAIHRSNEASRANSRRSKRRLSPKDTDAREKLDMVRVSGADGKAGRLSKQMDSRVRQMESRLNEFDIKRRYETSFWLEGSKSQRDLLLSMPEGSICLGGSNELYFPELTMTPESRISITGKNGCGKSTMIRHIINQLNMPQDKVIYIPQEISLVQSRLIMKDVNNLPCEELGLVMTIVSCLGSRPARLIGSSESSPGEIRKVLLALGVSKKPHLIIMDEPTNHLDLPAIECLEDALADCPCGLLLVSHDFRFLSRLAPVRWHLASDNTGSVRLRVMDTYDD